MGPMRCGLLCCCRWLPLPLPCLGATEPSTAATALRLIVPRKDSSGSQEGGQQQQGGGVGRPFFESISEVAESALPGVWEGGDANGPAAVTQVRGCSSGENMLWL